MELDDLKAIWRSNEARFERTMRLNADLIEQRRLCESGRRLRGLTAAISLEAAFNLVVIIAIGSFAADHARELRFFVPALLLGAYAIAVFAANVHQIVNLRSIDFAEPVVAVARRLENCACVAFARRWQRCFSRLLCGRRSRSSQRAVFLASTFTPLPAHGGLRPTGSSGLR